MIIYVSLSFYLLVKRANQSGKSLFRTDDEILKSVEEISEMTGYNSGIFPFSF